jgi:hypothetical protein
MSAEARALTRANAVDIANWCTGLYVLQTDAVDPSISLPCVNVPTAHGMVRAQPGDTVICLHDGSFEVEKLRTEPLNS